MQVSGIIKEEFIIIAPWKILTRFLNKDSSTLNFLKIIKVQIHCHMTDVICVNI